MDNFELLENFSRAIYAVGVLSYLLTALGLLFLAFAFRSAWQRTAELESLGVQAGPRQ